MEKANNKFNYWNLLRWSLSSVFAFIILASLGGFAISNLYQKEITSYILQELNKNLQTELRIGDKTEVSLIRKFPYASVKLNDVFALEVSDKSKKDTLFFFNDIFLQFNIVDILRQNYNIRSIQIEEGYTRIKINKFGKGNYAIFKPSSSKPQAFSLKLEKVSLSNITFSYADRATDLDISGKADEINLKGDFSESIYDANLLCRAILWNIDSKGSRLLKTKRIRIEGLAKVDKKLNQFAFNNAKLKLADLMLLLNGKIVDKGQRNYVDVNIQGNEMNIGSILSLIPEQYKAEIEKYKSNGTFYFTGNINGLMGEGKYPQIEGNFGIKNAEIMVDGKNIPLKSVNMTGSYTNGIHQSSETSHIEVPNFHAQLGAGQVNGSFYAHNFTSPTVKLACKANVNLAQLQQFIPIDTLTELQGQANLAIELKSHLLKPWQISKADLNQAAIIGKLELKDTYFVLKGNPNDFRDFDGTFHFKGNELTIEDFSGFVSESDFRLNGYFRNLLPYIFIEKSGDLYMNATLNADRINIDDLLAKLPKGKSTDTLFTLAMPANADVVLLLDIDEIKFRKFTANNISGNVSLQNKQLNLNGVNLETLGGDIALSGTVDGRNPNSIQVTGNTSVQNADISSLFISMDNFGQEYITSDNLKGKVGLKATFAFPLSPNLDINTDRLVADATVSIDNGELINFSPLQKLAKFVDLDELKNIRFSNLHNTISIRDKRIGIPQMDLNNNLLNIRLEGTHSFSNIVDYHFNLKLSDLMAKKIKKPANTEFGEEEQEANNTSIFVKMTGKASNPTFAYDLGGVNQKLKGDWKNEKKNIKTTLRNEFSRKLNDTVTKASTGQKPKLKMSWEEGNTIQDTNEPAILKANPAIEPKGNTTNSKTKKKGLFKDNSAPEPEKVKVEWE